ncbi:uncharacterized protein LOC131934937 [Physella acuta]|uniref:uncharacterized protein LOC131934937 n=1 Tax=Physella acuta TaxID=109671 RepID=UPI0027DBD51A|nr:uncharacterized protein LOC131934937 [Physella acuta]
MGAYSSDILTFVQLAKKGENSRKIRGLLEIAPLEEVMSWRDSDGLDVMHHVIIGNNSEVVTFLLQHGYFVRPHLPEVTPYCHLAALLGARTVLQILLQHRPDDYLPSKIPIRVPETVLNSINAKQSEKPSPIITMLHIYNSKPNSSNSSASSSSSSSLTSLPHGRTSYQIHSLQDLCSILKNNHHVATTPLELASRVGNLPCVRAILNQCILKAHAAENMVDKSDFTLACLADSPQTLALLLHSETPTRGEWESAVDVCLHHAYPECLDLLLSLGRETKHMFKGMNFFHVLFTYTSVQGIRSYLRLAQTTEVLVRHGHDVSAKLPCRTYPMYSLLTHAFCFHDYSHTQYYVKTLRVLLKNGADPSFDETRFERRHPKQAAKKVTGRQAFSSALHCLLQTVESYAQYLQSPTLGVKFVEDCAGVLMNNHANMNHVGYVGNPDKIILQGTVLHQMAKSSVTLGVDPAMVRCVLRHGANPNLKVDGKYAINVYFDQLFQRLGTLKEADPKRHHMDDALTICRLCMFMRQGCIRDCYVIFMKDHGRALSEQVQNYVKVVKAELDRRSRQVHPLRDSSAWAVWEACGRRTDRVHGLSIPSELKTYILPMHF